MKSRGLLFLSILLGLGLNIYSKDFLDPEFRNSIFWTLRFPSTLYAFFVGGALSLVGLNYQYLFRNNLASPYTLGVASVSALGASCFAVLSHFSPDLFWGLHYLISFSFCFMASIFLYFLYKKVLRGSMTHLLLSGVTLSLIASSLIVFSQFIIGNRDGHELMVSLMGNISAVGYLTPGILIVLTFFYLFSLKKNLRSLRLHSVNDEISSLLGVDKNQVVKKSLFLPTLLISFIVADCGPIAFVGLMVPHIVKDFLKASAKDELVSIFLFGGAFMLFCQFFSRSLLPEGQVPVGIVTSLMGGLFFLYLLSSKRSSSHSL
ncbi:MAG: FecCD family ABC transporter permease [Bacteriovoracaceae bacterium]